MYSPKLLLVNCITLLCLEHREGVSTSPSTELVSTIISKLPIPETTIDFDHGRQTFIELRDVVNWLNGKNEENFPSESEILQRIKVASREEGYLYEAVVDALNEQYENINKLIKVIQSYRSNLNQYLNDERIVSIINEYHHKLIFKRGQVTNIADFVLDMGSDLEPYVKARDNYKHPAMMGSVDFSELEDISKTFEDAQQLLTSDGALRLGWKGLNRALGPLGAIRRGEFGIVGGLQYNFKSGFMLSIFVHMALFNKPFLRDPTKKPLLYFISFENEIPYNLIWIYKYIKENEEGVVVVESEVPVSEASLYVSERMRSRGFEIRIDRFDPTEFTAASLISVLEGIISEGYEIQALITDYLNMISKAGIDSRIAGDDIRFLFRRIRNFTAPRGIAFLTPHQLSSDALQLVRDNTEDFVKVVAGKGYYDGCRRLGQEPDLELFIHIVTVNNESFLTIQRGKHRYTNTPIKDQYLVLPFKPIGTIPWDIDKDYEITAAMPGGGELGSSEESAWWSD